MVELIVNGTSLDLSEDIPIPFQDDTSFFSFLRLSGDFSWSFDLPATPKNRRALRFADLLESVSSRFQSFDCRILLASKTWKVGKLFFEQHSEGYFSVNFVGGNGKFNELIEKTSIRDLPWEDVSFIGAQKDHMWDVCTNPTTNHHCFYNFLLVKSSSIQNINELDFINGFSASGLVSPHAFVKSMILKICEYAGVRFESKLFEDPEMARLCLLTVKVLNSKVGSSYSGTIPNPYNLKNVLPDVECGAFLEALASFLNLYVTFDPINDALHIEPRLELLNQTRIIDWSDGLIDINPLYAENVDYELEFNVRDAELNINDFARARLTQRASDALKPEVIATDCGTVLADVSAGSTISAYLNAEIDDELPLYFLFYRGVNNLPNPLLSPIPRASAEQYPSDSRSTYWNGSGNFYDDSWGPMLDQVKRLKAARVKLSLTVDQLLNYDPLKLYRLGRFRVAFKSFKVDLINASRFIVDGEVYVF